MVQSNSKLKGMHNRAQDGRSETSEKSPISAAWQMEHILQLNLNVTQLKYYVFSRNVHFQMQDTNYFPQFFKTYVKPCLKSLAIQNTLVSPYQLPQNFLSENLTLVFNYQHECRKRNFIWHFLSFHFSNYERLETYRKVIIIANTHTNGCEPGFVLSILHVSSHQIFITLH